MISDTTRKLLTTLADRYETPQFIVGDPSWWMHQVTGRRNQEATAFVASALSYGSRSQFMPRIGLLLDMADGDMDRWLREGGFRRRFATGGKDCFYRLYNEGTMRAFFEAYHELLVEHGSLGEYLSTVNLQPSTLNSQLSTFNFIGAICAWFAAHSAGSVVPKDTTSACKRVCMFMRWMVRDGSPVDLGLWKDLLDKRTLVMPLDTHVVSEALKLNLLNSRCASMSAARRLTDAMREVFPDDPLRGDFALFGFGVDNG